MCMKPASTVRQTILTATALAADGSSSGSIIGGCDRVIFEEAVTATGNAGNTVQITYEYQDEDSNWWPLATSGVLSMPAGVAVRTTTAVDTPPAASVRASYDVTIVAGTITVGVAARMCWGG